MPTVLIFTYEFPPSGGGGVQRCAKFARYLPDFGWTPVVVTSSPIPGKPRDDSLLEGVAGLSVARLRPLRVSALVARAVGPAKRAGAALRDARRTPPTTRAGADPRRATGTPARPRQSGSARLARLVSFDDAAWWSPLAARAGASLGRTHSVSAVVASGPPFSVTVAGARTARRLGVPLVVDLRDAWRDSSTIWYPLAAARRHALAVERRVLAAADVVLAVTAPIRDEAEQLGARDVRILPNGFDPSDITAAWSPRDDSTLRLTFMGRIYANHAEPWDLIRALGELRRTRPDVDVRLEFIGNVPDAVTAAAQAHGVGDAVDCPGYLPHAAALERVAAADVGVLLIAEGPGAKASMTGKLFEYLAMGLPTLVLGPPDGEAAALVAALDAGWAEHPHDVAAIARRLATLAAAKADGSLRTRAQRPGLERYERRRLTGELAAILDEITATPGSGR